MSLISKINDVRLSKQLAVLKLFENDMVCIPNFLFVLLAWTQKNQKVKGWARRMRAA